MLSVQYNKIQAEKELAEEDAIQAQQPDSAVCEYNGVKVRHPDDMILYQILVFCLSIPDNMK